MKTFRCACGARVFFENMQCLACGRELGFVVERNALSALAPKQRGEYRALLTRSRYRKCQNGLDAGACNWLVPVADPNPLCKACRLNRTVPDLTQPDQRGLWAEAEAAKRRLLYTLNVLGLPVVAQTESEQGLAFDIMADTPDNRVLTGHADGLITLNLSEADPVLREQARANMAERYRTLLGHFRHESGHYYWDLLVRDSRWLSPCRALFGDERADYGEALQQHYRSPRQGWEDEFISAYATSHPWEDWAETWAHYLHITDTLETAQHFGLTGRPRRHFSRPKAFAHDLDRWADITIALNAVNRSMGMPDPYPFQLGHSVREKLKFVDRVVGDAKRASAPGLAARGGAASPSQPAHTKPYTESSSAC